MRDPDPTPIKANDTTPAGWVYPTSTATKAHWFPAGVHRSSCGKYGRFKSDHGWTTQVLRLLRADL